MHNEKGELDYERTNEIINRIRSKGTRINRLGVEEERGRRTDVARAAAILDSEANGTIGEKSSQAPPQEIVYYMAKKMTREEALREGARCMKNPENDWLCWTPAMQSAAREEKKEELDNITKACFEMSLMSRWAQEEQEKFRLPPEEAEAMRKRIAEARAKGITK